MSTAVGEEDSDVLSDGFRSLEGGLKVCAGLEGGGTLEADGGAVVDDLEQGVDERGVRVVLEKIGPCRGRESRRYIGKRRMRTRRIAAGISIGSSGGNTERWKDVNKRKRKRFVFGKNSGRRGGDTGDYKRFRMKMDGKESDTLGEEETGLRETEAGSSIWQGRAEDERTEGEHPAPLEIQEVLAGEAGWVLAP